jgi:gamma-F420-2:alpha-L-glutamate ligase
VVRPANFDLVVTRDDRKGVELNGEVVELADFLLPRTGARTTYYGLAVIRHLERLGVIAVNSSQCIETVMDKLYTHQVLAQSNLPVPHTMLVKYPVSVNFVEKRLGFPVVVKTLSGEQGAGVHLAGTKAAFRDLMEFIRETNGTVNLIVQQYIEASRGRDLRVFVIGGRPVACVERRAEDGGFKANHSRGGSVRPFTMTPEIEWLATETARLLELEIAGIDLLFGADHYRVCEANSAPGFASIEDCTDIDLASMILDHMRMRLGVFEWDGLNVNRKSDLAP